MNGHCHGLQFLLFSCRKMKSVFLTFLALVAVINLAKVSSQVILEVPGYAILNGTTETSSYTNRLFYAFRGVFYAEQPTPETRFLVSFVIFSRIYIFKKTFFCNH